MKRSLSSFTLASFACSILLTPTLFGRDTPANVLLVLEKSANNLVIVDPSTHEVLAKVPVGNDPHEVVASDDGKIAYISNYGRGTGATISRVDLISQKALPPIELGALRGPHGLAYAGGKLYFTAEFAKAVCRYDPVTATVDWIIGTGKLRTHMVLVSKDLKTVYTSDDGSATVSIIDLNSAQVAVATSAGGGGRAGGAPATTKIDTVAVSLRSEGFDLSPDGKELWFANAQEGTISIIDTRAKKIVATLPSSKTVNRIKFSPDGKRVFVPDMGGTELLVIDAATRKESARITLPGNAEGVVIAPDGQHAYTTLNSRDAISVIDLNTMRVTDEIKTGKGTDGLSWATRP